MRAVVRINEAVVAQTPSPAFLERVRPLPAAAEKGGALGGKGSGMLKVGGLLVGGQLRMRAVFFFFFLRG